MQGIKNLHSLNQRIFCNIVISKINYRNIPDTVKMLIDFKPEVLQLAFMHIPSLIQKNPVLIEKIVPRYFQVEKYVKEGLRIGINAKINMNTEAIPYCFMKGYEKYVTEDKIPETDVYDAGNAIRNFNEVRKASGKAKGPNCNKCKYNKLCEGPWRDYPEVFGWKEFKPVK
jgi:MoaA/NifB/PqqE/SkfB family radical SAM enzyme